MRMPNCNKMNLYDTKPIHCNQCGKFIGEMDLDAIVTLPKCGNCSNLKSEGVDPLSNLSNGFENSAKSLLVTNIINGS